MSADTCGLTCHARCSHLLLRPAARRRERKRTSLAVFPPLFTPREKLSTPLALCLQDSSSVPLQPARCPIASSLSDAFAGSYLSSVARALRFTPPPYAGGKVVQGIKSPPLRALLCKPFHPFKEKIMRSAPSAALCHAKRARRPASRHCFLRRQSGSFN